MIVPTRDRPDQLAECLSALAELDYPRERFEVVVVDDGGNVPLDALCTRISPGTGVRLLRQANQGPGAARNAGAEVAGGELLVFTDDDCRPSRPWLARLAAHFEREPEGGVGGHTVNALSENLYAATSQMIIDAGYAHANRVQRSARFLTTNNLALPAAGFQAIGGFDPRFRTSEDRDLCERWLAHGLALTYEPDAVVHHAARLDLSGFVRQHFAYGRGAYRFHRESARRGTDPARVDPAFYLALQRRPFRQAPPRQALLLSGLLVLWHVVNAGGFAWQAWRTRSDL